MINFRKLNSGIKVACAYVVKNYIFVYSATSVVRYSLKCNDFNDLLTKYKNWMNFFGKLRSTLSLGQNSSIFNSQKESNMAQALKEVKAVIPSADNTLSKTNLQKSEVAKATEATILNFDKTKSFNRFLEASCDCC